MKERVKEEKNSREGGGAPPLSTGHDLSLEKGGFFGNGEYVYRLLDGKLQEVHTKNRAT